MDDFAAPESDIGVTVPTVGSTENEDDSEALGDGFTPLPSGDDSPPSSLSTGQLDDRLSSGQSTDGLPASAECMTAPSADFDFEGNGGGFSAIDYDFGVTDYERAFDVNMQDLEMVTVAEPESMPPQPHDLFQGSTPRPDEVMAQGYLDAAFDEFEGNTEQATTAQPPEDDRGVTDPHTPECAMHDLGGTSDSDDESDAAVTERIGNKSAGEEATAALMPLDSTTGGETGVGRAVEDLSNGRRAQHRTEPPADTYPQKHTHATMPSEPHGDASDDRQACEAPLELAMGLVTQLGLDTRIPGAPLTLLIGDDHALKFEVAQSLLGISLAGGEGEAPALGSGHPAMASTFIKIRTAPCEGWSVTAGARGELLVDQGTPGAARSSRVAGPGDGEGGLRHRLLDAIIRCVAQDIGQGGRPPRTRIHIGEAMVDAAIGHAHAVSDDGTANIVVVNIAGPGLRQMAVVVAPSLGTLGPKTPAGVAQAIQSMASGSGTTLVNCVNKEQRMFPLSSFMAELQDRHTMIHALRFDEGPGGVGDLAIVACAGGREIDPVSFTSAEHRAASAWHGLESFIVGRMRTSLRQRQVLGTLYMICAHRRLTMTRSIASGEVEEGLRRQIERLRRRASVYGQVCAMLGSFGANAEEAVARLTPDVERLVGSAASAFIEAKPRFLLRAPPTTPQGASPGQAFAGPFAVFASKGRGFSRLEEVEAIGAGRSGGPRIEAVTHIVGTLWPRATHFWGDLADALADAAAKTVRVQLCTRLEHCLTTCGAAEPYLLAAKESIEGRLKESSVDLKRTLAKLVGDECGAPRVWTPSRLGDAQSQEMALLQSYRRGIPHVQGAQPIRTGQHVTEMAAIARLRVFYLHICTRLGESLGAETLCSWLPTVKDLWDKKWLHDVADRVVDAIPETDVARAQEDAEDGGHGEDDEDDGLRREIKVIEDALDVVRTAREDLSDQGHAQG